MQSETVPFRGGILGSIESAFSQGQCLTAGGVEVRP